MVDDHLLMESLIPYYPIHSFPAGQRAEKPSHVGVRSIRLALKVILFCFFVVDSAAREIRKMCEQRQQ